MQGCGNVVTTPDGDDGPVPDDGWCGGPSPSCDGTDVVVDVCPPGATCYERGFCGNTVVCRHNDCLEGPSCPSGMTEVEFCGDAPNCFSFTACGSTVFCLGECNEAPTCNEGDFQVDACPPGATCYNAFACGGAILCAVGATCTEVPSCDLGDTAVGSDECPTDIPCYTASTCGMTIACFDDLPYHPCPDAEPVGGTDCSSVFPGLACDYPQSNGCLHQFVCEAGGEAPPIWNDYGLTCPD
jgi:hypothetical protein